MRLVISLQVFVIFIENVIIQAIQQTYSHNSMLTKCYFHLSALIAYEQACVHAEHLMLSPISEKTATRTQQKRYVIKPSNQID